MIRLSGVTRWYGRRGARPDALTDVTLTIPRGSVWAVVGPNGAGKSTLLSLILGFVRPSRGAVEIAGEAPRDYLRSRGACYLPERFDLPRAWVVRDALQLHARLDGLDADAAERAAALFGLEAHLERRAGVLSRGLLQRLGLAQALIAPHELVILDEPTEGLDPVWRIRLRDIITSLRDAGSTVIIASHDLAEVERVADRAVLLDGGTVRDVIAISAEADPAEWDVSVEAAPDAVATAFPSAQCLAPGSYRVRAGGAVELSERLAALIELGGVVHAVQPLRQALEDRVREALERDS